MSQTQLRPVPVQNDPGACLAAASSVGQEQGTNYFPQQKRLEFTINDLAVSALVHNTHGRPRAFIEPEFQRLFECRALDQYQLLEVADMFLALADAVHELDRP